MARDASDERDNGQNIRRSARAERTARAALNLTADARKAVARNPAHNAGRAIDGAVVGGDLVRTRSIRDVLEQESAQINKVGLDNKNNRLPEIAGHVAEADHAATFNVDAAFQGKAVHARQVNHRGRNSGKSVDIVVENGSGQVVRRVQSKVYKTAEKTADAQRGYGDMDRLTPTDQADRAREYATTRAQVEAKKPGPNRAQVAREYEEVAARTTDRIDIDGVSSQPRLQQESRRLGERAKEGKVTSADIVGSVGTRAKQGMVSGAKRGAIAGGVISGVIHTAGAVSNLARGEKPTGDAAAHAVKNIAIDTADATIKGAASGAATAAARVVAERVGSSLARRVLGSSAPAVAAVVVCDAAAGAIKVAAGRQSWTEYGQNVASSVKAGAASLIGAELGFVLGGPIGAVLGGFLAPIAVEFGQSWLNSFMANTEVIDASALTRAVSDPTNIGAALLAMAKARSGVEAYRLIQLASLFDMLGRASAHVFPGRVVTGRNGYQTSAAIVVVHEGRTFAVDLRAWKGHLYPYGRSSRGVPLQLIQRRERTNGLVDEKVVRNPILGPSEFSKAAKVALSENNERWRTAEIEPIVVFPTDEVTLEGGLANGWRMLDCNGLEKRLKAGDGRATPGWMLDDLAALPVWDSIQTDGRLVQAALETPGFKLTLMDGTVDVPFNAVAQVIIDKLGAHDPDFAQATVHLKDATILAGVVGEQPIDWNWKGQRERCDLRELSAVCPGSFIPGTTPAAGRPTAAVA